MSKLKNDVRAVFPFFVLALPVFLAFSLSYPPKSFAQPFYDGYDLPGKVSLCGEPIPISENHVWEMLDQEFTLLVNKREQVLIWLKRSGRYFPYIEKRLIAEKIPEDLKYIPVNESSLLTHAISGKGASGLWQFMPKTARRYNLKKNRKMDERRSFERSTDMALKYLKDLKDMFATWTLAIAAYNCGEKRLQKEIREQKTSNYYRMNLPLETERYVFRIIAIKTIMENPERYGYHLKSEQFYKPLKYDTVMVKIKRPIHITDFAQQIDTDFKTVKELNQQIRGYYLPSGSYAIHVPAGKKDKANQALEWLGKAPSETTQNNFTNYYVVEPGDTLSRISQETGVSINTLISLNNLDGTIIRVGQKIQLTP